MKSTRGADRLLVLLLLMVSTFALSLAADSPFRVEQLTKGVYLYRPDDGDYSRTNSMVVERSDGLLVVDAQPTPAAARELLAEISRRHTAPLRYLVYSHHHAESTGGGSAFPPTTLVIASEDTQKILTDPEADLGAEMRARAPEPQSWTEPKRRAAVLVVRSIVTLDDPIHPAQILVLGLAAHSPGDLMVKVTDAELYYVGGMLLTDRNPYAVDADVRTWIGALNHLISERPKVVAGLRGPALERTDLMSQRDALAWINGQVESEFTSLEPLNVIEDNVLKKNGVGERFDLDADPCFLRSLVHAAVEASAESRRKRGIPVMEREDDPTSGNP